MSDYTEEESKVDVGETFVNLNSVKNDPDEEITFKENLHRTQYKVPFKYENLFSGFLHKRDLEYTHEDNLIGFLDNDAIMENVVIKLEGIKREDGSFNYCNNCNGDYKGYCIKCSSLLHILNNTAPLIHSQPEINTTPIDIVEIRDTSMGKGVFLLKALPNNVIFGPFEGLSTIESAKGFGWKINDKRLANVENGNWMKDIACTANVSIKNLDIFQMKENLYYQTNREIMEGEELLIYYNDEEIQKSDKNEECYFIPRKEEKLSKIFACIWCCLGFSLVKCLMEHKRKCPHVEHNTDIQDFELVECHCCKIWLEKKEHQEYHMGYCWEKYLRTSYEQSQPVDGNDVYVEEIEDCLNTKVVHGKLKCSQSFYETNYQNNLENHLNKHKKGFQCDLCMTKFTMKSSLKRHIKYKHAKNGTEKNYQCSECSYQTNYKQGYQAHLNRHRGIKPFECATCKMKFSYKAGLEMHMKSKHSENGCAKDYQCSECTYQTNYKKTYQIHLNGHRGINPFECSTCKVKFTNKMSLRMHMNSMKHTKNVFAKNYQCSYQTNYKQTYQAYLNRHHGIKPFECGTCKKKFSRKDYLQLHIKDKHTENGCAKDYQCSECSYQTNYKQNLRFHLTVHIKSFECDTCKKKFGRKDHLQLHIKDKHTEGCAKDYQCSECTYQTNYKQAYQTHLNVHIKSFECDTCKKKFGRKEHLQLHIKDKHTEGCAKDYQYSECSYQTNYKHIYQAHLNRHTGIKSYECETSMKKFTWKPNLARDIKNTLKKNTKVYRCSECFYQTNYKHSFQDHLNSHSGVMLFECDICTSKFTFESALKMHLKDQHTNGRKAYDCGICMKKFTVKASLKKHIKNKHTEN